MVTLLALVFAYNACSDYSDAKMPPADPDALSERDDVAKVLADGRVLMRDGSIRRL